MIAILLAAVCACRCPPPRIDWTAVDRAIEAAAKKTDRAIALERERKELDAIVRRNRERFERGDR